MSRKPLRKSLPTTRLIWIQPSDEAIDWAKTVEKVCEDNGQMEWLKAFEKSDLPLEDFIVKFKKEAKPLSIYTMYTLAGFKSDLIVAKEGQKVLQYVFEEFTLADSKFLQEVAKEKTEEVVDELINLFERKLITVMGVDEGFSRKEIIQSCVEDLRMKDVEMLNRFITESIQLNVEKKNTSVF